MSATRRRFLKLIAAGSAAAAIAPASTLAQTKKAVVRPKPAARPRVEPSDAVAEEIRKQKGYVAETLRAIRGHTLPLGSASAAVFRPLKARRRTRSS
jgi:hypothetical protein